MSTESKGTVFARWLLFVPGAAVSALAAGAAMRIVQRLGILWAGFDPNGFLQKLFVEWMANLATGFVFVYVAALIAPAKRFAVASLMAIGLTLLVGFLARDVFLRNDWWSVFGLLVTVLGAGVCLFGIATKEFLSVPEEEDTAG